MNKMKKVFALVLTIAMALSLAACGAKKEEAPAAPAASAPAASAPAASAPAEPATEPGAKPEGYPEKTVAWIAPVAAGAAVDLPTRVAADLMDIGQPVVVENIAGASQTLGTAEFAARPADGYTLLTMANACGIAQPLMNDVAYDLADFRYIAMLTPTVQATLCVKKDSEFTSTQQLIDYMKANEFVYGIPNAGGYGHMVICKALADLGCYDNGLQMVYNGSNDNIAAILNGEVDFASVDSTDAIKNPDIRVLTIMDQNKCELFPDAELMGDFGVSDLETFVGMKYVAVRKDTPAEIVDYLKAELNRVIQSKEYQDYLVSMGFGTVREYSEEELHTILAKAAVDYGAVMKAVGLIQ